MTSKSVLHAASRYIWVQYAICFSDSVSITFSHISNLWLSACWPKWTFVVFLKVTANKISNIHCHTYISASFSDMHLQSSLMINWFADHFFLPRLFTLQGFTWKALNSTDALNVWEILTFGPEDEQKLPSVCGCPHGAQFSARKAYCVPKP